MSWDYKCDDCGYIFGDPPPPACLNCKLLALRARLESAESALREVATTKHLAYENNECGSYGIGVTDGHRCAASSARKHFARYPDTEKKA